MQDIRPCRIVGLTSAKGQKLNGTAARAPFNSRHSNTARISVLPEGQPSPLSLKQSNIQFLPENILDGGIGVGRDTIRDMEFIVAAVDCMTGDTVCPKKGISGPAPRCLGNLMAALDLLKSFRDMGNDGLVIMCTDLNVSRAIDIMVENNKNNINTNIAFGQMNSPIQQTLISIQKCITKEMSRDAFIMSNYRPHRLKPDGFEASERRGEERYIAVTSGRCSIYPCVFKDNWDSMEVRYVDSTSPSLYMNVRHETYLDYGPDETELYIQNAAALDELDRLYPQILAQVDPQAFLGAVLHIETCVRAVTELGDVTLVEKWEGVRVGIGHSRVVWNEVAEKTGIRLPPEISTWEGTPSWPVILKSDTDHERVASGGANIALLMMLDTLEETTTKSTGIDIIDSHRVLEVAGLACAISKAKQRDIIHVNNGNVLRDTDRSAFMKKSLEEAEYGNIFMSDDPLEYCQGCKKIGNLKQCSICKGVAYCGTECARTCWKAHKKECRPSFAHIRRSILYLASKYGITIEPLVSNTRHPAGMISEASGAGSLGIMWNPDPGQVSFIMPHDTGLLNPSLESMVKFRSMSELDPPLRFLLSCGPLGDIDVARGCIDEAISMIGGDICKLKMQSVLFNPLEWAAKKGHIDIVEWLCTDKRTKSLIHEGCSVGWACYTGQIDVARRLVAYGADPSKTDRVLFYNCPPLLVAAENGELEAMKYLVNELGQDINMIGATSGRNVIDSIKTVPGWNEGNHLSCYEWAISRMG